MTDTTSLTVCRFNNPAANCGRGHEYLSTAADWGTAGYERKPVTLTLPAGWRSASEDDVDRRIAADTGADPDMSLIDDNGEVWRIELVDDAVVGCHYDDERREIVSL